MTFYFLVVPEPGTPVPRVEPIVNVDAASALCQSPGGRERGATIVAVQDDSEATALLRVLEAVWPETDGRVH